MAIMAMAMRRTDGALCLTALFVAALAPYRAGAVELSALEQAYLSSHPVITYCTNPNWEPFEVITAQGRHEGIAADLLQLVASRTGITLRLVPTANWEESLAASRGGRCQLLSFLNQSPSRDHWLIFTNPLFIDSNVFITRDTHPFIVDPTNLTGESIAFPVGTSLEERIRQDYPNIRVITTKSEAEAIAMVLDHRADMTMRSLIMAIYVIKKDGLYDLKIAGQLPDFEDRLSIGVRKSEPMLRQILNKGIATISVGERATIINNHIAPPVRTVIDYSLIAKITLGFLALLGVAIWWSLKLRRLNTKLEHLSQTDSLTGLYNRAKLNQCLPSEIERAARYGRPLSLIMIDFDLFKSINDRFGHLAGDKVLMAFASIAHGNVRGQDCVGRWGGEEFLVLCPETTGEQAFRLATRLCEAVRHHDFGNGMRHTISAGVAAWQSGDDVDGLLRRADQALYRAKDEGRDRVVSA